MRRWLAAGVVGAVALVAALAAVVAGAPDQPGTDTPPPPATADSNEDAPPRPEVTPDRPAPVESIEAGAFVIWARGDLTRDFAAAIAALPEVTAAAHVRSTTVGLLGSRTSEGDPQDEFEDGFRIPVSVAAIDPDEYAATLPPGADRAAVLGLGPGEVLLSRTGATLRSIGPGAVVDLVGRTGLRVAGIVDDGAVGRGEIVLHDADAAAVGLDEDGTVFLLHDASPGAETSALVEQIEALVPDDVTARIVDVGAGQPRRRAPLVLSLTQIKETFGEFAFRPRSGVREIDIDAAFPAEHIVTVDVPILGSVTCHADIVDDLRGALRQIVDAGLGREIDPARYAGCYYPRRISAEGDRLSSHSWGIALDINVDLSLPELGPPPHPDVVTAFEEHGFRWGGDFIHPDNHHFEWVGEVTDPPATYGR